MGSKDNTGLAIRMKEFEQASKTTLTYRLPLIVRLDMKAGHTYTKNLNRPFDERYVSVMHKTAKALCEEIQGAQIAYIQSDEISILIHNYKKFDTQSYFKNQIQKITSITGGVASATFTMLSSEIFGEVKLAVFDSRVFVLPESEVCNYFLFRQKDASRNSIQMLAQSIFSHKQLHNKNISSIHEMLHEKNINWNDLPIHLKRGACIVKAKSISDAGVERSSWNYDLNIPEFNKDRSYINDLLKVEQE